MQVTKRETRPAISPLAYRSSGENHSSGVFLRAIPKTKKQNPTSKTAKVACDWTDSQSKRGLITTEIGTISLRDTPEVFDVIQIVS